MGPNPREHLPVGGYAENWRLLACIFSLNRGAIVEEIQNLCQNNLECR